MQIKVLKFYIILQLNTQVPINFRTSTTHRFPSIRNQHFHEFHPFTSITILEKNIISLGSILLEPNILVFFIRKQHLIVLHEFQNQTHGFPFLGNNILMSYMHLGPTILVSSFGKKHLIGFHTFRTHHIRFVS
jgi:hypothetical protein